MCFDIGRNFFNTTEHPYIGATYQGTSWVIHEGSNAVAALLQGLNWCNRQVSVLGEQYIPPTALSTTRAFARMLPYLGIAYVLPTAFKWPVYGGVVAYSLLTRARSFSDVGNAISVTTIISGCVDGYQDRTILKKVQGLLKVGLGSLSLTMGPKWVAKKGLCTIGALLKGVDMYGEQVNDLSLSYISPSALSATKAFARMLPYLGMTYVLPTPYTWTLFGGIAVYTITTNPILGARSFADIANATSVTTIISGTQECKDGYRTRTISKTVWGILKVGFASYSLYKSIMNINLNSSTSDLLVLHTQFQAFANGA